MNHTAQAAVLLALRREMDARGLATMPIAASDESRIDQAIPTWQSFNASVRAAIGLVNVHGYEGLTSNRSGLYQEVTVRGGKRLQNSEFGDGGLAMAQNLHLDWSRMKIQSFSSACFLLAGGGGRGWGCGG